MKRVCLMGSGFEGKRKSGVLACAGSDVSRADQNRRQQWGKDLPHP